MGARLRTAAVVNGTHPRGGCLGDARPDPRRSAHSAASERAGVGAGRAAASGLRADRRHGAKRESSRNDRQTHLAYPARPGNAKSRGDRPPPVRSPCHAGKPCTRACCSKASAHIRGIRRAQAVCSRKTGNCPSERHAGRPSGSSLQPSAAAAHRPTAAEGASQAISGQTGGGARGNRPRRGA